MFTNIRTIKIAVLVLYGCCLIALSMFKTAELFLPTIYAIESWLGGDKLMHLKLSAVLTVLALLAFVSINERRAGMSNSTYTVFYPTFSPVLFSLGICGLLVAGLLIDELHQAFVSTRRFEWCDLAYGASGISIGFLIFWLGHLLRITVYRRCL